MTTEKIETTAPLQSKVHPVPCRDWLTLDIGTDQYQGYHYRIFTLEGRILQRCPLSGRCTSIHLSNLPPSTYLLEVVKGEEKITSHKFIKA